MIIKRPWGKKKPPLGARHDHSHPLSRGLIGHWLTNEGGGLTTYDISGNSNNGIITGNPVWTQGQFGPALQLDGTGDYIVNSALSPALTGDFTVTAFVKANASETEVVRRIFDIAQASAVGFNIGITDAGELYIDNDGVLVPTDVFGPSIFDGTRRHVGAMRSGTTYSIWADGRNVGSVVGTVVTVTRLFAGAKSTVEGNELIGAMDDIRLYKRALSPMEVAWLYADPFADMMPMRLFIGKRTKPGIVPLLRHREMIRRRRRAA